MDRRRKSVLLVGPNQNNRRGWIFECHGFVLIDMSQPSCRRCGFHHHGERLGPAAFALAKPLHRSFIRRVNQKLVAAEAAQRDDFTCRQMTYGGPKCFFSN